MLPARIGLGYLLGGAPALDTGWQHSGVFAFPIEGLGKIPLDRSHATLDRKATVSGESELDNPATLLSGEMLRRMIG